MASKINSQHPQRIDALMLINTVLSAGILIYVVNTEHRITKLETRLEQAIQAGRPVRPLRPTPVHETIHRTDVSPTSSRPH